MRITSLLAGSVTLLSAVALASPATAATSYDPDVTRVANPANVCKSIPGTIGALTDGQVDTSDFDLAGCVSTAAKGGFEVPGFGDPYAQCEALVGMGVISYPVVLHGEPGDPFPDLLARNSKQCGNALYAFHSIEAALSAPPS